MSGSNTICVVTALLETGTIPMKEPTTVVTLETTAGLVRTEAECRDGRCGRVTFAGVPSFVEALDVALDVPGVGQIAVDVAYGGCFYVLVAGAELGVRLTRDRARDVVERAELVMAAAERQIPVRHPEIPEIDFLSYVMVTGDDDPAGGRLRGARPQRPRRSFALRHRDLGANRPAWRPAARRRSGRRSLRTRSSTASSSCRSPPRRRSATERPSCRASPVVVGSCPRTTAVDPTDPYVTGFVVSDVWGRED